MSDADVLIVGGGIVGAACARACALAGLRPLIVEREMVGSGATAAGMGHIVVMDDSPAQWALTLYGRTLWRSMRAALPLTVEYEERGTLWVAADEEEMAEAERKRDFLIAHGVAGALLDRTALCAAEPHLRDGLAGALHVPEDGVLYPPAAAAALLAESVELGGKVILGDAVRVGDGQVRLADGTTLRAPFVVLATGVAPELLPRPDLLRKRKGHLLITDRYPGMVRHQIVELGYLKSAHGTVEDSVACNIQPRQTGQLLIGSSRQFGDEDPAVRPELLRRMLARAIEYLPGLQSLSALRVWTGFRAATPDKLPLVGPAEALCGDPTLHLALGHEGLGITTSLATAELLVDGLLGRRSAIAVAPYLPARVLHAGEEAVLHA